MKHQRRLLETRLVIRTIIIVTIILIVSTIITASAKQETVNYWNENEITQEDLLKYLVDQIAEEKSELEFRMDNLNPLQDMYTEKVMELKQEILVLDIELESYAQSLKEIRNGEKVSREFSKDELIQDIIERLEKSKENAGNNSELINTYEKNLQVFKEMLKS